MKAELNFLELHFLVEELQSLVGCRVDKVYEPDSLLFQLHKSNSGKVFLKVTDKLMWLAKDKPLAPESVSGICSALRKYLKGKKLTVLEQLGSERIARFTFQTQKETCYLYVEFFSNGNVILTNDVMKILFAREERAWKDREIKRGLIYELPPAKQDLFALKEVPEDEKSLAALGFGKLLAKEIVARKGDFKSLFKEKLSPRLYSDGELSSIKLVQYKEAGEAFPSFSELIDARLPRVPEQPRVSKAFEAKKAKLQDVIDMQSKNIERMEKDALEFQRKGEIVYEHYQELKDILEELNKAKAKFSLQEIKAKLKGHAKIKDLNPKTSDVVLEVND